MTTTYKNRNRSILSRIFLVNQLIEQLVQIQDIGFFQGLVFGKQMDLVVRLGMPQCLIDIAERFPTNSQPIFNDHLCFGFCKAVAFNRVAGIRQPDTVKRTQRFERFLREWSHGNQLSVVLGSLFQFR